MLEAAGQISRVTSYNKSWIERQLKLYQRLEDFSNKVIEFDTRGATRARMAWENGKNVMYIEADVRFERLLPLGKGSSASTSAEFERRANHYIKIFEAWGGQYQVFGNQDLRVEVKINRASSAHRAAVVNINNIGDMTGLRSFAWGGKRIFGWKPSGGKVKGLVTDETQYSTAIHEFGHWLGLQDAYSNDNMTLPWPLKGAWPLAGVTPGVYSDYDDHSIMNITGAHPIDKQNPRITNNDMEMVVLAFHTGQRQNYQVQFPWEKISEAMGRGN